MLKFELYNADSGTSVGTFLGNPTANYTNNTPDLTLFMPAFDTRTIFPTDSHLNYFGQVSGWITPTVTTNYVFYIRASDQADLFLSTDDTTNNLSRVAADFRNGPNLFFGSENFGTQVGNEYSSPVPAHCRDQVCSASPRENEQWSESSSGGVANGFRLPGLAGQ